MTRSIPYRFAVRDHLLAHRVEGGGGGRKSAACPRLRRPWAGPAAGAVARTTPSTRPWTTANSSTPGNQFTQGRWSSPRPAGDHRERLGPPGAPPPGPRRDPVRRRLGRRLAARRTRQPGRHHAPRLRRCRPCPAPQAKADEAARAREACCAAARIPPRTPRPGSACSPWTGAAGRGDETGRLFEEVRSRHPEHHHAHHLMTAAWPRATPRATRSTRCTTSPPGPPNRPPPTPRSRCSPSSPTPSATAYSGGGRERTTPRRPGTGRGGGPGR